MYFSERVGNHRVTYINWRLNLGRDDSTGKRENQGSFPQDIS